MADIWLRPQVVPPDGVNDVRLYPEGADAAAPGGTLFLRTLMGVGLMWFLVALIRAGN